MSQPTVIYDVAKETIETFRYLEPSFALQVPNEFLVELEQFASQSTKAFQVDTKKNLLEQAVSEETAMEIM